MRRLFGTSLAVAVAVTAVACGGEAVNDTGGAGHAGSSGGSGGVGGAGAGGAAAAGGAGGGSCPTTLPYATACAIEGQTCSYPNGPCCPAATTTCTNGQWYYLTSNVCKPSPPMACPAVAPANGSPCVENECSRYPLCSYSCPLDGSSFTASCTDSIWSVSAFCPSYDGGTSDCSAQLEQLTWFASLNKSCTKDADCTILPGACSEGADYCDGSFYVSRNTDTALWNAFVEELRSCYTQHGFGCAVCDGIAPPPMCVNAVCQAPLRL